MWGDIRQEEFNINSFTAGGGGGRLGEEEEPHSLCQHFIDFVQGCSNRHLIVNSVGKVCPCKNLQNHLNFD